MREDNEEKILTACALRFDGYKYQKARHPELLDIQHPCLPRRVHAQMYQFFMLQRFLCKWGGEYLEDNSPDYQIFRELFLIVCRRPVPLRYRFSPYWEEWERNYAPHLEEFEALIRRRWEDCNKQ